MWFSVFNIIEEFYQYIESGGFVMWPLMISTLLLWYGIGYRATVLRRGSKLDLRELIETKKIAGAIEPKGFIDSAIGIAWNLFRTKERCDRRSLEDAFFQLKAGMGKHRALVRTIVIIAPLAGLLGTVSGMIEMFDSLGDQTFYSQTGGIANGISQALFTTQFGLFVAVPGLIIGRLLDRKEDRMKEELFQLIEFFESAQKLKETNERIQ